MRCTGFLRRCCSESPCFWAQNLNRSAMRINGPIISFTHFPSFHMYIRPNGNFPQVTVSLEGESRAARRATSTPRCSSRIACTAAGASSPRASSRESRSRAFASSAATPTSPTPRLHHASATVSKPTYPLAGGSSPHASRRPPPKTRIGPLGPILIYVRIYLYRSTLLLPYP